MKVRRYLFIILFFIQAIGVAFSQNNNYFTHTVSKGQTLYSISRMYQKEIQAIVELNPGCDKKLSIGQVLRIPQKPVEKVGNAQQAGTNERGDNKPHYHTIKAGETLYRLGKMYNVTPLEICHANPGLSINNFRTGEVILIPTGNAKASDTAKATPAEKKDTIPAIRTTHKVGRGEKYDEIADKYGITTEELIKANPGEANNKKPKRKTILNIPYPTKKVVAKQGQEPVIEDISNKDIFKEIKEQMKSLLPTKKETGSQIALILPFQLNKYIPDEQTRMIEYYEGFLLAVNKLKDEGYSFDIHTYDSGGEKESLEGLVSSGKLDNMDLIIGALYPEHNKQLARYAKEKNIPLVLPFTSKEDEIFRNPMVYVVNTMQSYFFSEVIDHFAQKFPNANVIFVEDTIKNNKKEFITAMKEGLGQKKIPYTTIQMERLKNTAEQLTEETFTGADYINPERENIFIPMSSSAKTLSRMLPSIIIMNNDTIHTPQVKLFGYPEWQIYGKEMFAQFYAADTYFYASFFSHYTQPEVTEFQKNFVHWYNKDLQNIYPSYGMLGYDTGYTFLLAISRYGKEMPNKINSTNVTPIQTGFKFERVNNWGGMVNKKIYFIHYSPEYKIEKIDFDK